MKQILFERCILPNFPRKIVADYILSFLFFFLRLGGGGGGVVFFFFIIFRRKQAGLIFHMTGLLGRQFI